MGRVSRYKKIRSVDPYSKQNGGNVNLNTVGVWGLGVATVKTKKRSLTAQRLYDAKINTNSKRNLKQQQQQSAAKSNTNNGRKESKFGSSSYRHNFSSDEQPLQDEFDLKNLTGSLKKESSLLEEFMLHTNSNTTSTTVPASVETLVKTSTALNLPESNKPSLQVQSESSKTDNIIDSNLTISKALQREDDKMMKKLEQQVQQKHQKLISPGLKLLGVNDISKTNNEVVNSDTTATTTTTTKNISRKDGESMKDYRKRRQHEMKLLTSTSKVQLKRNLDKVARKKEFLTNKKKKRKNNKFLSTSTNDDDDDNYDNDDEYDGNYDNDATTTTVEDTMNQSGPAFEQQVERPPIFRQLPRGAIEKKNSIVVGAAKTSTTKLSSSSSTSVGTKKQQQQNQRTTTTVSENEMEKLRLQVQAQYAILRSQRQLTNKNHTNSRLGRKNNNSNSKKNDSMSSSSLKNGRIQYPGFLE